jgi:hypothetical protein
MRILLAMVACLAVAGCATSTMSPQQRADAANDVPENHPHPPPRWVPIPADQGPPLRCWDNGEDTVCKRDPN